eukprot:TRINITY_DN9334_c0_g1_i3.p1 TRINITY_DN9334_c0_g1~~TRINITY_DN9334_c0_g1_i3.p1  ORF type:complete len:1492 (-),score=487.16 TRINITY_DN9334_c0_g1_i3:90-4565(-)
MTTQTTGTELHAMDSTGTHGNQNRYDEHTGREEPRSDIDPRMYPSSSASSSHSHEPAGSVIDVESSKQEFQKFNKDMSEDSRKEDPEKGDDFDLRTVIENDINQRSEAGIKLKHVGVVIKDLNVVGVGADTANISTNLAILKIFYPPYWIKKIFKKKSKFHILRDINALCKDGEMLLVLGRPGSGCSSLLRVIANQRKVFLDVQGDVKYGGISAKKFRKYMGESIYMPEEDVHYPTLTLRQTMDFTLRTKTPGTRLSDEKKKKVFRERLLDTVLNMFGLTKQADTRVGNEFIRGLSGGERKRLAISEALVTHGAVTCWDGATRGLDSASALDYAKALRVLTDTMKKTTVASFYQASESIYEQFDRVLVLDKGRCIYFGPIGEARQYFQDLGFDCEARKSTPDFVTGVTNAQERKVREGFDEKVPQTSDQFEKAFKESDNYKRAMEEIKAYEAQIEQEQPEQEFREAVHQNKAKHKREKSVYTTSIWGQAAALARRQAQIITTNRFDLFSRYFSVVIQGLIYGTTFIKLPLNAAGGFTRGGALFAAILFNSFLQQAELPATFIGRRILQRHKSYAMYHPSSFYLAQVLLDIPLLLIQVVVFSCITYWLYGLDKDAGKFFIYITVLFLTALAITQLFRMLGYFSPSLFLSQQMLSLVLIVLLTYTGYSLPVYKMQGWLRWIYYVNPFAYAFKALFANEMRGLVFDCSVDGHIPAGPSYTDPAFRVCILPGAVAGATRVTGEDYLSDNFDFKTSDLALNILIVLFFFIGYTAINMIGVEFLDWARGGHTQKVFKKGEAPPESTPEYELEQARIVKEATKNMKKIDLHAGCFMWKELDYTVKTKEGERILLDKVSGWIKPGQMTALMGASGAGKTTLLDVLARRKTQGKVEGTLLLNGLPLRVDFERITGYVEQMDVHNPFLTVREALRFSAKLRQDPDVPVEEKEAYVEQVIEMMEMKPLAEALIGDLDSGYGISVEERKRLTIGMELVAKPQILFLDEPTSGLDSQSAYNIIKFLRRLADAGMPLVCTIHQPSSVLFEYFDRLLLLAKGGKTVYFGDIGENSQTLTSYLTSHGAREIEETENPAEYILEAIGAGVSGKSNQDWVKVWLESDENKQITAEIEKSTGNSDNNGQEMSHVNSQGEREEVKDKKPEDPNGDNNNNNNGEGHQEQGEARKFASGWGYQLKELYKRFNILWWRNPSYNAGRIFQALCVGLVIGLSFLNLGFSTLDLQIRVLAIFSILILGVQLIAAALPQILFLRTLFQRDYASRVYSWGPFSIALILVELPYLLVAASLAVLCSYWLANLDTGSAMDGFFFWIAFVFFIWYCHSFGQLVGAASPNFGVALLVLPIFLTIFFLFAGALSPPSSLPRFWQWVYWVDPFHYFLESVITTVFHNITVVCDDRDLYKFNAPSGLTCGEYAADFFASGATGYIANPDATSDCGYCQFSSGQQFYEGYGWSYDHRWRNFGFIIAYWIFNIVVATFFIYLFRKPKR